MSYKVLVVDDQIMPRQLCESIINAAPNYEVVACIASAAMADIYCAKEHIDLILMDIVMNDGSNGLDVASVIKKSYPEIKIIMMTSMPDSIFLKRAREIGVDSFWYKEVQDVTMLDVINRTMNGEHIYPDTPPVIELGYSKNTEFTERETDVLRAMVQGLTDNEIADELHISYYTVRSHINSLLNKTGCSSRTELAIRVVKSGIIVPEL